MGYHKSRFKEVQDDSLICPICDGVCADAVQCPDEHLFCEACIKLAYPLDSFPCPVDQKTITTNFLKPYSLIRRLIGEFEIKCIYDGCEEYYPIKDEAQHLSKCPFKIDDPVEIKDSSEHKDSEQDFLLTQLLEQVSSLTSMITECLNKQKSMEAKLIKIENNLSKLDESKKHETNQLKSIKSEIGNLRKGQTTIQAKLVELNQNNLSQPNIPTKPSNQGDIDDTIILKCLATQHDKTNAAIKTALTEISNIKTVTAQSIKQNQSKIASSLNEFKIQSVNTDKKLLTEVTKKLKEFGDKIGK